MTTQQDSVDVERLRSALEQAQADLRTVQRNTAIYRQEAKEDARLANERAVAAERALGRARLAFDAGIAALSLPITQRDEQAKTYDDGVEDAAKIAEGHYADFRCAAPYKIAGRSIATAIRRLSIEQGDQDGGGE